MGQTKHPVRFIEIRNGVSEDGGGIEITVRMDGVEPDKVLEVTLNLLNTINLHTKGEDAEFKKSYG